MTPAGVAALLHVDPRTVTRWAQAGKLSAIRTPGGHRRYLRSEVLAVLSDRADRADRPRDLDDTQGPHRGPAPKGAPGPDAERRAAAAAVVAEAVALALEAAADEAAEAVAAIAAAVTEAAGRAAAAAQRAREARAFAAQAAARSVALEAERTATRVQARADLAAERVQVAASLAAAELGRCLEVDATIDPGRMAASIAVTVRTAAEATDEDTSRAACAVRSAGGVTAAQVVEAVAAAERSAELEVTAAAASQRDLATATAVAVALEADIRAAGAARAAREAAAALLSGGSEAGSGRRDSELRIGGFQEVGRRGEAAAELSHDLRVPLISIIAASSCSSTSWGTAPSRASPDCWVVRRGPATGWLGCSTST